MSNFYFDDEIESQIVEENKVSRKIKAYSENIMMVEVLFENDGEGYLHKHQEEQVTYCLEGEFCFTIGEETKNIAVGDTIYMPANVIHGCKLLSKKGRLLDVFTPYRKDFLS